MFLFFVVLLALEFLVIMQGFTSHADGYLSQKQMKKNGVMNGWSFIEHGGMWADFFLVSPLVAYIICKYSLAYMTCWGLGLFVMSAVATIIPVRIWVKTAIATPEAHAHDGKVTVTGWLHIEYMILVTWVLILFYTNPAIPHVSVQDLIVVSCIMTIWAPLGVIKFSHRWKLTKQVFWQVIVEINVFWIITMARLVYSL